MKNIIDDLIHLVSKKTGLCIRERDLEKFLQKIEERVKQGNFSDLISYYELLQKNTLASEKEWKELFLLLTVAESYFFRDIDQFLVLKKILLPKILEAKKTEKTIRIWSAGCCAGEEPYSIAIILKELLGDMHGWNILILGNDINEEVLQKARKGIYTPWSLRDLSPEIKKLYFKENKGLWELDPKICQMVKFTHCNLVEDVFPSWASELHSMDIIFCRNVFIYFSQDTVGMIANKLSQTLNEQGYLITGHGELYAQKLKYLKPKIYNGCVVYHKKTLAEIQSAAFIAPEKIANRRTNTPPNILIKILPETKKNIFQKTSSPSFLEKEKLTIEDIQLLFKKADYKKVVEEGKKICLLCDDSLELLFLMAQSYANMAKYENAIRMCLKIIKKEISYMKAYFLLSQIYKILGDRDKAKSFLQNVIYLDPYFVLAYIELGELWEDEGDSKNAKKMFSTALEILESLPHTPVLPYKEITTEELIKYLQKILKKY